MHGSKVHTRNGELALTLQESSVGSDELLRLAEKNPLATIPSSEVLRLPRACSILDPNVVSYLFLYPSRSNRATPYFRIRMPMIMSPTSFYQMWYTSLVEYCTVELLPSLHSGRVRKSYSNMYSHWDGFRQSHRGLSGFERKSCISSLRYNASNSNRSHGTYIDIANGNSAGHFCGICEGGGKGWWW